MKTKHIWMLSGAFGLTAALFLCLSVIPSSSNHDNTKVETTPAEVTTSTPAQAKVSTGFQMNANQRAIALSVNEVQGVAGFLKPGEYVDVIILQTGQTMAPGTGSGVGSTEGGGAGTSTSLSGSVVIPNIKVLAVGAATTPDAKTTSYHTVTVEAAPADADRLALASQQGSLYLMLRPQEGGQGQ